MKSARSSTLAMTVGLLAHGAALGQATPSERPWYLGVAQDFTHESNALGSSTDEISDTISTTALRAGVNQLLGRQRLYANGTLSHQRYRELTERNGNGYTLGLGLDWATIERLSGNLTLHSQRRQVDFNVGGITPVSISNQERSDELGFRARLGATSILALETHFGHRRVTFSAPEFAAREYRQNDGSFGVVYRPSAILSLSTGVSGANTRYLAPETGQPEADRAKRKDLYVAANWVPTGASTVDARVSFGKQEYDRARAADFEGVTGALTWLWRPSGRLSVTTSVARDTGQELGYVRTADDTVTSATDFSQVANRASLSATYELTGKVTLTGELSYARRNLVDGPSGATSRDNTTAASLTTRWAVTRTTSLGCMVRRESRSASGAGSSDFDNDRVGCFGSVTID